MRFVVVVVVMLAALIGGVAHADGDVTGMVVTGPGDVVGTVASADGKPMAGVIVHLAAKGQPPRTVTTDASGRYRAPLPGKIPTYIFVEAKVKLAGSASVAVNVGGGVEAIETHEPIPPAVLARIHGPIERVPDYSDKAEDADAWTRAWLLLDIDPQGRVFRVKLLDKPGLDLEKLAVRDALALRFDPARDRANKPIESLLLWKFEWPPYFWMQEHERTPNELPPDAMMVDCRTKPTDTRKRDCSKPTVANAVGAPWLVKP